ncbi:dihydroxyacetone kinase subunit DhaL [Amycolatopsis granulosa]|uniref:dihydroxyacetone kinase subunit DhaL n=1 Tax=Amycolatopsis granulosa TaxID=185684 RepID=UPI0014237C61|nr:dihydroxyacetone kinase subunit DhaL [Amycolatopsis granulosa]NIH85278.1 dihydroxyacetone kinase phosphoprotein-dependent L subunit [Amycolatopsis granulosa]
MTTELAAGQLRDMLVNVADRVIAAEPELSKADREVGDGDHGLGMTRGFTAARAALAGATFDDVHAVFTTAGNALLRSMGGASGVIFGLLFRAGAADRAAAGHIDVAGLADHFARSLAQITERGGAAPGDKTMVDALEPAARALAESAAAGHDLRTAVRRAAEAAADGADRTRNYLARFGKAVSLKDRSLGHPDPGALSTALIFTAMADWADDHLTSSTSRHGRQPMNNAELTELNKRRKIYQIAFITRDLEKSMRSWVENLGIGPWTVLTFTEETMKYLKVADQEVTEPFKFLIAISWIGDMQLEIIQPVYGPTIYEDHLARKGEGLHHIKEQIPDEDIDRVLAGFRDKGIGVLQTGQFETDVHYYLGTEPKLDFIYELGNCPLLDLPPDMVSVYPPEDAR